MRTSTAIAMLFLSGIRAEAQACLGFGSTHAPNSRPNTQNYVRSSFTSSNPLQLGDKTISVGLDRNSVTPARSSLTSVYASVPAVSGNETPNSTSALLGANYSLLLGRLCPVLETAYAFDTTASFSVGGTLYFGAPVSNNSISFFGKVGYTRIANHVGSSSFGSNTSVYRAGVGIGLPKDILLEVSYSASQLEIDELDQTLSSGALNRGQLAVGVTVRNKLGKKLRQAPAPAVVAENSPTATRRDSVTQRADVAFAELDSAITSRLPTLSVPRTTLSNPKAVAVVIGNRNYSRSEVPAVDYAHNDAEAMRAFLVRTFGFRPENILFELDATYISIQRIFGSQDDFRGRLFNRLASDSLSDVFVFYSGHGAPDMGSGAPYIVPIDADPQSLRLTAYPLKQLYRNLSLLPAKSVTVIVDACFSGFSDKGALIRGVSPIGLRVDNPILAKENSVVFTASSSNEVSGWLDQRKHGIFTYSLLRAFDSRFGSLRNGFIPSFTEIGAEVQQEVLSLSRRLRDRDQTPQLFGMGATKPLIFINP